MKNILSYQPGTRFTGAEIKSWIIEQIQKHTSHERLARYMTRFSKIKDERLYFISIEKQRDHHDSNSRRIPRVYRAS